MRRNAKSHYYWMYSRTRAGMFGGGARFVVANPDGLVWIKVERGDCRKVQRP